MGTVETLIVFSALMALIAVVTIGIDWIGKPLKNRRFIPRIYRFDDEKLPVDAYGNTHFSDPSADVAPDFSAPLMYGPHPYAPQPPIVAPVAPVIATAQVPVAAAGTAAPDSPLSDRATLDSTPSDAATTAAPQGRVVPATSASAFSDSLAATNAPRSAIAGATAAGATIAGTTAPVSNTAPSSAWLPGMALDTSIDGRKPSLAAKAERFWISTEAAIQISHFDDENLTRMAAGKAPRRSNPRTGRTEAMQLTGLRQASDHTQVRMRWPDDALDPWASS